MSDARDPYLDLPLHGVQLIEASAGTGKTFTLATLVTRLVVERGLRIGQILAVTFTEAATQELRKRIRERLQLTLALLDAAPTDDDKPEARLTHALLDAHRGHSGEGDDMLRRRLRQAVLEIDLAAIFTIHGFCARVLREHALESGQGFDAPELLANDIELRKEVAAGLWRSHAQDRDGVDDLSALWSGGYEELARDLPALLREPVLLPPAMPLPPDPRDALDAATNQLLQAINQHAGDAQTMIAKAFDDKVLHGSRAKRPSFEKAFVELADGREARHWPRGEKLHIDKLLPEKLLGFCYDDKRDRVPASPLFDALAAWVEADEGMQRYLALRRAALLHTVRDDARTRIAALKRQRRVQTYDDMIDGVADALADDQADGLARALRAQYAVALVDEFQDTDARQWAIFDRVFGGDEDPALFLIGDPKQAIYGFRGGDVHTYLAAGASAAHAPPLSHNFRSRPSLLRGIAALYANAGNAVSTNPDIRFHPVEAGDKRSDADYQRDGDAAPAMTLWQAPPSGERDKQGKPKPHGAPRSRELATDACVAAIHAVLSDARNDKALLKDKDKLRAVQPGDIAVLVRSHHEATMVQQALALAGIAAVAAGKQSLFATGEARDLHALLLALLHGGDDGRLRAALATVLIGQSAEQIAVLDTQAGNHRHWQLQAQTWRDRLLRGGPLALVNDLAAEHAPRLLGLLDGERRVSNLLQLAELLQEAARNALGLQGLVDWLGQRIADADVDDETQLLRLESDARRVQIVTLHKSKGLEYPLVFLPFVGIGRNAKSPGRHCVVHDELVGRRLHWKFDLAEAGWDDAKQVWAAEQTAEDARLFYVGLTRAEHALWIATGQFFASDKTPLHAMLGDPEKLVQAGIVFDATQPDPALPRLPPESEAAVPAPRQATRRLANDWWVHSFSQLAKAESGDAHAASTLPATGGHDEPDAAAQAPVVDADFDPRFAGNRYGVALHAALEHAEFSAWSDWRDGDAAPDDEAMVIAEALREQGYAEDAFEDGIALTTKLIGHTLTVALPEGVRLCDVPADERRAEIEFQFALRSTQVEALLALLHRHGVVRERDRFGARQRLEGLMTGLIDLTYRHDGRWYVLDYKSNRLPRYDEAALAVAMAHSEYDLQALIYTLALHRWLRFRLGDAYDYARDFGGIRYVFCRGLDADRADSADESRPGIHAQRFAPELVHALDALFGHASPPLPLAGEGRGEGRSAHAERQI